MKMTKEDLKLLIEIHGVKEVKSVVLITGLPGSGKTHLGTQMAEQFGGLLLDDIGQTCGTQVLNEPLPNETIIITDPALTLLMNRRLAESKINKFHPGAKIHWFFFANDPDQCWKNIHRRNDGRLISFASMIRLSERYVLPEGETPIPVWSSQDV